MTALCWMVSTACVGWAGGSAAAVRDEVSELGPTDPGTYRMVGTERDSRTADTRRVVETYTVQPAFARDGADHQITELADADGTFRRWETAFRAGGAYRLREAVGDVSWDWAPALRSTALPLRIGRSWTARSAARLPDLAGTQRIASVRSRSEVVDTASVVVGGTSVFTFVIDARITTSVTDTNRATREVSTFVTRTAVRSWFAPKYVLVVRSAATTTVRRQGAGVEADRAYHLVRRVQLEEL